jgi:hypothetical protein
MRSTPSSTSIRRALPNSMICVASRGSASAVAPTPTPRLANFAICTSTAGHGLLYSTITFLAKENQPEPSGERADRDVVQIRTHRLPKQEIFDDSSVF